MHYYKILNFVNPYTQTTDCVVFRVSCDDDVFVYRWPAMIERDPDTDDYLEFHKKPDLAPV